MDFSLASTISAIALAEIDTTPIGIYSLAKDAP